MTHPFRWQLMITGIAFVAICLSLVMQNNIPLFVAMVFGGIPAVLQIIIKLVKGDWGADVLAALAVITAILLHQYLAAVIVILMISSGQALEVYAMRKASSVLLALEERMPRLAHLKKNEIVKDIPVNDIQIDDIIIVYPHETCPVDGVVVEGYGSMDESYLTGEPYRIEKIPGAAMLSGAINGETVLTLQASKLPSESRYASIVAVLEKAEQKRPTLRRLADQIGSIFAPFALLLALLAWYYSGDVMRFLAVLVIATPCPLLIAIPVTIISAISMAAQHSIIIKDPAVLERLPTCKTAIFDKTGTLTYGKPLLVDILVNPGFDPDTILLNLASIEKYSKHPLASAILHAAEARNLILINAKSITEKPGKGLSGVIDNNTYHVTSRKKILEQFPAIADILPETSVGLECMIMVNNEYAATLRFIDMPRQESKAFISHLAPYHNFNKIMLVSGDRESEVKHLAQLLNLTEIHASQSPEQKLEIVRVETKKAPTLFMGDGINDAPALTAATVGVAFGQFSNVTAASANAVIMENTLNKVDELIHLSLLTRKIALQSAIGGMALSLIGMGFAAAGFISPVMGAILQEVIDVIAIINSLRLIWIKPEIH